MEDHGYELPINFVDYLSEISPSSEPTLPLQISSNDEFAKFSESLGFTSQQSVDILTAVEIVFYVLLTIASVGCNAIVLAVILKRRTFHSPTNGFVSSLCVSNLLLGLIVLPGLVLVDTLSPPASQSSGTQSAFAARVHRLLRERDGLSPLHSTPGTSKASWSSSSEAQAVGCETIVFLTLWFSIKNVLTSMMIALDRWYAIAKPMEYPKHVTQKRATVALAAIWVVSMVPAALSPCIKHILIAHQAGPSINRLMGFRNQTSRKTSQGSKFLNPATTPLPISLSEAIASIPHYYFSDDYIPPWPSTSVCFWHWSDVPGAAAAICLLFVIIPFIIACIAYFSLYRIAVKHAKQIRRESKLGGAGQNGLGLGLLAAHEEEARRASFHIEGGDEEIQLGMGMLDEGYGQGLDPESDSLGSSKGMKVVHSAPNLKKYGLPKSHSVLRFQEQVISANPGCCLGTKPTSPLATASYSPFGEGNENTGMPLDRIVTKRHSGISMKSFKDVENGDPQQPSSFDIPLPPPMIRTVTCDEVEPDSTKKPARPNELLVFSCENRRKRMVLTPRQMIDIKKRPHLPLEDKLSPVRVSYLLLPPMSYSCPETPLKNMEVEVQEKEPVAEPNAESLLQIPSLALPQEQESGIASESMRRTDSLFLPPPSPERRLVVKSNPGNPELWVTGASLRRKNLPNPREVQSLDSEPGVHNPCCCCQKEQISHNSQQKLCTCLMPRHSVALGEICRATEEDGQLLSATQAQLLPNFLGIKHAYSKNSLQQRIRQNKQFAQASRGLGNPRRLGALASTASHLERRLRGGHMPRRSSVLSAMDLAVAGANLVRKISSSIHFKRPLSLSVGWMFPYRSPSKALRTIALILGGFLVTWGPTLTLIFAEAFTAILELAEDDEDDITTESQPATAEALKSPRPINGSNSFDLAYDYQSDEGIISLPLTSLRDNSDLTPAVSSIARRFARFAFYLNTLYHPLVYGIYPKVIRAGISTLIFRLWHRFRDVVIRRWRRLKGALGFSGRGNSGRLQRRQTPFKNREPGYVNKVQTSV